jgi:hypothetical protein
MSATTPAIGTATAAEVTAILDKVTVKSGLLFMSLRTGSECRVSCKTLLASLSQETGGIRVFLQGITRFEQHSPRQ